MNQQLSNLSGTVAVNLSLNPGTDNTLDLGSSANSWRTLYADTSVLTPTLDTAAAGTLSLGGTATAISLLENTAVTGTLTTTGNVGVGIASPSTTLHVRTNNATVNQPQILVEQAGSGDSSIEFKDASGKSFYVGMDASAGSAFKISSSTAAQSSTLRPIRRRSGDFRLSSICATVPVARGCFTSSSSAPSYLPNCCASPPCTYSTGARSSRSTHHR